MAVQVQWGLGHWKTRQNALVSRQNGHFKEVLGPLCFGIFNQRTFIDRHHCMMHIEKIFHEHTAFLRGKCLDIHGQDVEDSLTVFLDHLIIGLTPLFRMVRLPHQYIPVHMVR